MKKGFTLIELLVVIGIAALLSTLGIIYGSEGRNEVAISVEAAKESQLILQAKALAIASYGATGTRPACGYGMYFDYSNSTYSLFIYNPQSVKVCPTIASTTPFDFSTDAIPYSQQSWNVPVAQGLVLKKVTGTIGGPSVAAVIFIPPNPQTLITTVVDSGIFSDTDAYVEITTTDGSNSKLISVTNAGQVSF